MPVLILLFLCITGALAEESPNAPVIEFRELEWWAQTASGSYGWWPGQDGTPFATNIGRIEEAHVTGPQQLVWEHRFYDIQSVTRTTAGQYVVGFEKGTLVLSQLGATRRWQITFTRIGETLVYGTFRTFRDSISGNNQP